MALAKEINARPYYEGKNFDGVWVAANRDKGDRLTGWLLGISDGELDQVMLITDKGTLRNFKTLDSAILFVSENGLREFGNVFVSYS